MPSRARKSVALRHTNPARVFAALGDQRRLRLVRKLCGGNAQSISQLTAGSNLTRQAITMRLQVLERAGVVRSVRRGRESLYEFAPEPLAGIREYLDFVSAQWDDALGRLTAFVQN